jgi:RNA polymerase sigma-70 factor (ECF subfamily)
VAVNSGDQDNRAAVWLDHLAEGDPSALEKLYDEFATQLYAYALGMISRPDAAEEAVQELFLMLVKRRGRLGHVHSARAYIFAMLRNAIWRRLRRKTSGELGVDPIVIFDRSAPCALPEGAITDIEAALMNLPPKQKEVVMLKVYQNMTFPEIARVTGVSTNTVNSQYRYALERLRSLLPPDLLQDR